MTQDQGFTVKGSVFTSEGLSFRALGSGFMI